MPADPYAVSSIVPKGKALPRFGPGYASGGGGGSGVTMVYSGAGSPEGVVTASIGAVYTNTSTGGFWNKVSGDGLNTGWNQLIA